MATLTTLFCCGQKQNSSRGLQSIIRNNEQLNKTDKALLGAAIFDLLAVITTLAIGILGALSVFAMPASAAYALIAVGGAFTITWLALAALSKGDIFTRVKLLAQAAIANCKSSEAKNNV